MDGSGQSGKPSFETARSQRERVLLSRIAACTPAGYWIGLASSIRRCYKETLDSNRNDSNLLQQSIEFKTISDRHFYADKVLHDKAVEFGFVCVPELIKINKWRYAQVDLGPFTSIQKYCHTRDSLPKAAAFRKKLAQSGGISIQDDILRPRIVDLQQERTLNGILIHGPLSRNPRSLDFGEIGFVCYAIPYDDYSDWAAVLDIDKLIASCQIQVKSSDQGAGTRKDGPTPVWRKRPEREE